MPSGVEEETKSFAVGNFLPNLVQHLISWAALTWLKLQKGHYITACLLLLWPDCSFKWDVGNEGATNHASLTVIFTFLKYEVEKRLRSVEVRRPDQHRCNLTVSPHAALIGTFDPRYAGADYISVQKSLITQPCCPWEMSKLLRGEAILEKNIASTAKAAKYKRPGKSSFNMIFFLFVLPILPVLSVAFLSRGSCKKSPQMTCLKSLNSRICKEVECCTQTSWRWSDHIYYNLQLAWLSKLEVIWPVGRRLPRRSLWIVNGKLLSQLGR